MIDWEETKENGYWVLRGFVKTKSVGCVCSRSRMLVHLNVRNYYDIVGKYAKPRSKNPCC